MAGRVKAALRRGFGFVAVLTAMIAASPAAAQRLGVIDLERLPYQAGSDGNFSHEDFTRGRRQAPSLLKAANVACTVTEAAYVGKTVLHDASGKADGYAVIYEAACAEGLGYLISAETGKPPLAFDCVAAQSSKVACMLAQNRRPATRLDPYLAAAGVACKAQRARLITQSETLSLRRYEVACNNGGGYVLDLPLPTGRGPAPAAADCLQNTGLCSFTPHVESVALLAHQIATALGAGCQVSDARYIGYVEAAKSDLYELACRKGQEGRLVEIDGHANVRTLPCGGTRLVGAACQLRPAERVDPLIAHAQTSGAAPPLTVINPDWVSRPNGDDFASWYPRRAINERVTGQATLGCVISDTGQLRDCFIADESPAGYEFGKAALGMSTKFRLKTGAEDGVAVSGQHVYLPINFAVR